MHQRTMERKPHRLRKAAAAGCGALVLLVATAAPALAADRYKVECAHKNGDVVTTETASSDRANKAVVDCLEAEGTVTVESSP